MADSPISALTAVAAAATTNELAVNEAGTSKRATLAQVQTLFAATQAIQETGTATTSFVTPGVQHFHPSSAKFWVKATANSTTIVVSYNMTSWADTAVGQATGTIATDFSSGDWCGAVSILDVTNAWTATYTTGYGFGTQAAGTFRVDCSTLTDGNTSASNFNDPDQWFVTGYGDHV